MGPAPQRTLALVAVCLAAGCMPYARGYLYLDGEGITHEEEVCRTGPPVWAVVTARNVTVKVTLDPGVASRRKVPILRLVAPNATRIEIPEPIAYLEADGKRQAFAIHQVSARRDYPDTPEGRKAAEMYEALRGKSGNDFYTYEFAGDPVAAERGRVELPALMVEGERVVLPTLTFDRRAYVGYLPLNC